MGQYAEEILLAELGKLYETYGYLRYKTSAFEEYDFYSTYKAFLLSEPIISFTSPDGRLMALKPDVTLSIAKNVPEKPEGAMKVYYRESVYRQARKSNELREITQAGLELIGDIDRYSLCEVMLLAKKSLDIIGGQTELAISHMGFISALMNNAGLFGETAANALDMISRRSSHELVKLLTDLNVDSKASSALVTLISSYGSFDTEIDKLSALDINSDTHLALSELISLREDLAAFGISDGLSVDFSIINDMDYYNGLIFKGYVDGVSHCALSGGRYDKLINKLGKSGGAVGFAVYPDAIDIKLREKREYDIETLILYSDTTKISDIARAVEVFSAGGHSVMVSSKRPVSTRFMRKVRMLERGFEVEC